MGEATTAAYRGVRERVTALLRGAGDDVADRPVGACPAWTVRQVVAHLTGACDDVLEGRLDGVASDAWTAAQVDARADRSLEAILDEWAELAPRVEALFGAGGVHPQMVFDAVTHEHDVRAAVDRPGAREGDGVDVAYAFVCQGFPGALRGAALPGLVFRSPGGDVTIGDDPQATVTATAFDLLRSCSGRRTRDQIAALDWGGADPTPWLPTFTWGPFRVPEVAFEVPDQRL
jgi:uncharacterized protein (TIGR03083 family)